MNRKPKDKKQYDFSKYTEKICDKAGKLASVSQILR